MNILSENAGAREALVQIWAPTWRSYTDISHLLYLPVTPGATMSTGKTSSNLRTEQLAPHFSARILRTVSPAHLLST